MKWMHLTSLWTMSFAILFLGFSMRLSEVDPIDDLSLTLKHAGHSEYYRLISENQVADILSDRLDVFPKSQISRLAKHLVTLSKRYGFDPSFILSLIEIESGFHIRATSQVGALGLMQIMLPTAQFVIENVDFHYSGFEDFKNFNLRNRVLTAQVLTNPFVNLAVGIAYLAWLRDHYKDRAISAYCLLAAYNVGPARMDELLARPFFRAVETKKYYLAVRKFVPIFRFYHQSGLARKKIKTLGSL